MPALLNAWHILLSTMPRQQVMVQLCLAAVMQGGPVCTFDVFAHHVIHNLVHALPPQTTATRPLNPYKHSCYCCAHALQRINWKRHSHNVQCMH